MNTTTAPSNTGGRPLKEDKPRVQLHSSVSAYTHEYITKQTAILKPAMPDVKIHDGMTLDLMKSFCARKGFDVLKERKAAVSALPPSKPLPRQTKG